MTCTAAEHLVSAGTIVWTKSQPRGEVRRGSPSAHVESHFTYERLSNHHVDTVDACQIHSADALQFAAELELRSILVWFGLRLLSLWFSFFRMWRDSIRKTGQVTLQLLVALSDSFLVDVVHVDFLFQHKEQLLAPGAFQAFGNLLLAGMNPRITKFSQLPRIALSCHDGTHDLLPGWQGPRCIGPSTPLGRFPIARSINHDDSIVLTPLTPLKRPIKQGFLVPSLDRV